MSNVDILIPDLPESIVNVTVATWHKKPGDTVIRDKVLVEIEIDRVVLEVSASANGILDAILEGEGTTVTSRQILDRLREGNSTNKETSAKSEEKASTPAQHQQASLGEQSNDTLNPAIRRLLTEHSLDASAIKDTGVGGRLAREDAKKYLAGAPAKESAPAAAAPAAQPALAACSEKCVPMTRLRKRAAGCLLEAENSTAMLTMSDGVNVKLIMDLRKQYGEAFEKRHGIRPGFMSFCVKTVVKALKRCPEVDASTDGDDVVYHSYFDVSMMVSTPHGLMIPVLRDIDTLGIAGIEKKIKELTAEGRDGKLTVEDLTGGSFTIINGGVLGSLVPTSIINPPQSTILGIHAIKDRPIAINDQVEILPMMYLALLYDHRLTDGCESMGFLVTIKGLLEDPTRLLPDMQQFKLYLHCRPTQIRYWSTV